MGQTAIINKHVDDFGIMSKSKQLLTFIRTELSKVYEITVEPTMKYYLGYHIVRDREKKKIYLEQTSMINDMATNLTYLSMDLIHQHRWSTFHKSQSNQYS
jgi:hypothetical protein